MRFIFSSVSSIYNIVKFSYRIIVYRPLHAVSLVLFFSAHTRSTFGNTLPLASYNQCPIIDNKIQFEMMCYPEDELYQYYHVIKNVPSLRDVNYFLFGEMHGNATHLKLKFSFANKLAVLWDSILFEGMDASQAHCCSALYYSPSLTLEVSPSCTSSNYQDLLYGPENVISGIRDGLRCQGWDDIKLHELYHEPLYTLANAIVGQDFKNSYEICRELLFKNNYYFRFIIEWMANVLDVQELIKCMEEFTDSHSHFRQIYKSFANYHYPPVALNKDNSNKYDVLIHMDQQLIKILNGFNDDVEELTKEHRVLSHKNIIERNQAANRTFNQHIKGRLFSFFGMYHLISKINYNEEEYEHLEKDDPQYEFRRSLDNKPHAILIPRR